MVNGQYSRTCLPPPSFYFWARGMLSQNVHRVCVWWDNSKDTAANFVSPQQQASSLNRCTAPDPCTEQIFDNRGTICLYTPQAHIAKFKVIKVNIQTERHTRHGAAVHKQRLCTVAWSHRVYVHFRQPLKHAIPIY